MPGKKDVLPLGSLCVESIIQVLVEIVQILPSGDKLKEHNTSKEDNTSKEGNTHDQQAIEVKDIQQNGNENHDTTNKEQNNLSESQAELERKDNTLRLLEGLNTFRKEFVRLLTSHSHVSLHEKLFSTLVSRISSIYMTKKKTRPYLQDIVPHFINSSLREFNFEKSPMFAEASMCQVLFDHLENASRLNKLDIGRSCYWRVNVFEKLSSKFKSLPELKTLRIQYICTPEMIQGLVENCPNLCELNLKGSERITDKECNEIAKCVSLKYLDITGTRITGQGCWRIIESIKALSWLHHCAFNCNSDALLFESRAQLFDCIREQANRRENPVLANDFSDMKNVFNLKNFWLFNPCSEDMLSMLLCPQLEQLRLDFIFQDLIEEPDVGVLSQIPMLNKFQANLYDRCAVDLVTQMLENCGSKLSTLDLHMADDYFFAAQVHNVVAQSCPNLVTLHFSGDYKARHSLDACDSCLDFEIQAPAHPHLKHISITGVVTDRRLHFILNHTPALRTLCLDGELEWIHDDMFKTVLDSNPLLHLEKVWFNVSTTLTLATVRLLLLHDNSIHTIGRLCHMANANMNEYQDLQDLVRQNNLEVKLIWVTDERNR